MLLVLIHNCHILAGAAAAGCMHASSEATRVTAYISLSSVCSVALQKVFHSLSAVLHYSYRTTDCLL